MYAWWGAGSLCGAKVRCAAAGLDTVMEMVCGRSACADVRVNTARGSSASGHPAVVKETRLLLLLLLLRLLQLRLLFFLRRRATRATPLRVGRDGDKLARAAILRGKSRGELVCAYGVSPFVVRARFYICCCFRFPKRFGRFLPFFASLCKLFASYAKKGKKDSLFPHLLSEDMHAAAARTAAASGLICPPLPGHQARGARGSRSRGTLSVTSGAYESPSIQFLGSAARLEVMKPKPLFSIGLFADAQYADKDDYERPSEKGRTKYFRAVPERLAVALRDFKSK